MKILPKIGVDDIQLGMNKSQVQKILGKPDHLEKDSDEERWEFDSGMELGFGKEDLYLLGSITVFDESATLDSQAIIGMSEENFLTYFPHFLLDEDFEENGRSYDSEQYQILAWVHEGIVANVTVFPEYESTGQIPIWPKSKGS
jgi:SmpA / OmlA family